MKVVRSICGVALSAAFVSAFAGVTSRPAMLSPFANHPYRGSSSSSSLHMSSASDFAKTEIGKGGVVIFSKSYCPFCKKTKTLFNQLNVDARIFELNEMDNGAEIQDALLQMTGQKTVPNVFINGKHVGGNDDVQAANKSGALQKMLN